MSAKNLHYDYDHIMSICLNQHHSNVNKSAYSNIEINCYILLEAFSLTLHALKVLFEYNIKLNYLCP